MKVLIVENEKPAVEQLQRLLSRTGKDITVAGVIETVEGAVNWLLDHQAPDLILMDIQLDDGLCFEIFDTIQVETPVIFTTAYDEYALKAFRVNSIDYLLKPVEQEALNTAIAKFESFHPGSQREQLQLLLDGYIRKYRTRFLIKSGPRFRSVQVKEICFFHIMERSTFLRTFSGREYAMESSLDMLQKEVDPGSFFRINRNCLINIDAINEIISYSSSRLQVKLNDKEKDHDENLLVVSREKVSDFKRWIDQ